MQSCDKKKLLKICEITFIKAIKHSKLMSAKLLVYKAYLCYDNNKCKMQELNMQIKINEKILSIPSYISTKWSNIVSIYMNNGLLHINLLDENIIPIPDLDKETIDLIFKYHALYLESHQDDLTNDYELSYGKNDISEILEQVNTTMQIGIGPMHGIANSMQHNPRQSDAPDLPQEILEKIAAISKILKADNAILPEAFPSCNCFHCQIARTLNPCKKDENEESIYDSELNFQQWDIAQTGENLFSVMNRLDHNESYHVYLGEPIGCTCGKQGCEHIIAVLKT